MAGAGVLIATFGLKVVLTIPKMVLIVPIYLRSIKRHDQRIKQALKHLEEGNSEEAAQILAEFSVDVINEMWQDFLLLCRGVWRMKILEKPLWMLGAAIAGSYLVMLMWAILSASWFWTISITVGSFVVWWIYKAIKDISAFVSFRAWCSKMFTRWQERGSDWVLKIVHDQDSYENERDTLIARGIIDPPEKMTWSRCKEMIIDLYEIFQTIMCRVMNTFFPKKN